MADLASAALNLSPCGQMWVGQLNVDRADAENGDNYRLFFARRSAQTIGNFWVDMTRTVLYVLLPISIVVGIFFVWQGALPRRRREFMPFDGRSL